jgi:hypothetical protein
MKTLLMYMLAALPSFIGPPQPAATNSEKGKGFIELTTRGKTLIQTAEGIVTLRSGTPVVVECMQTLNSKNLTEGQTVNVRVKYNVIVNKQTVIAAGALGNATISEVQKPGIFGKGGRLEVQIQSVQSVDGQQILVSGMNMTAEGQNRKGLAWGLSIPLLLLTLVGGAVGFLIKGKAAELRSGTTTNTSVASDAQIDVEEQ